MENATIIDFKYRKAIQQSDASETREFNSIDELSSAIQVLISRLRTGSPIKPLK